MKQRSLHKDNVRFSGDLVGYDADGDVSIEERPSLFRSSIAFVVDIKIVISVQLVILPADRRSQTCWRQDLSS